MVLPAVDEGGSVFGRYRLLERLGAGGMAIVYRALAEQPDGTSRELVIKRLLPELSRNQEFASMLVAEARLSARLNHPNIVQVYELGRVGDEYYLSMELIDGYDLVRLLNGCLKAKRPLPVALGCYIVVELARALAYAHELTDNERRPLAIVHRDVSPSNVMLTKQGAVKLLDFGVAKAAEHIRDERTRTGTLKGKVNYLSPEAAEGLPADQRTDIFALGIVLHETLTLRRLFKADGDLQTLRMIREAEVAAPSSLRPEVSPELDRVVLKMLARDPAERYQSCTELLHDLGPISRELGGDAAGLAQLIGELPVDPAVPQPVDEQMDSGPTPVVEIESLIKPGETGKVQRTARPRWLPAVMVAAVVLPAMMVALIAARWNATPPAVPLMVAPAAPVAPKVEPPAPRPEPARAPAAPPGVLIINTGEPQARIMLDGVVVSDRGARARIPVARAGEHEITITAPRRKSLTRKVTVAAGATVQVSVKMEKSYAAATKPNRGENYLVNPFDK